MLVPVRNYNTLYNLGAVLDRVDPHKQDVVVLHLRFLQRAGGGEYELAPEQLFSLEEQKLFTRALEMAEKKGKTIHLAVAAATEQVGSHHASGSKPAGIRRCPGRVPDVTCRGRSAPRWSGVGTPAGSEAAADAQIYFPTGQEHVFYLGPHAPHLTPKEIDLLHSIWLEVSNELAPEEIHHHDIVHLALEELQADLSRTKREEIMRGAADPPAGHPGSPRAAG